MIRYAYTRALLLLTTVGFAGCAKDADRAGNEQTPHAAAPSNRELRTLDVPPELRVNGSPMLTVHAEGVQIYTLANGTDGTPTWKLKAPDATFRGQGIEGRHYAGPTWECTTDGSKVVGRKLAEHASPDPHAVGWLLLEAKSHAGNGVLSKVSFIQRINTVGGKAPTIDGAKTGDEIRVPYQADYVFYGPGATTRPAVSG
jgi:hypothetical protein